MAETLVAYMSVLLVRRGDAATARPMLQVERWMLEWDDQGREKDLILEVDPANRSHFTNDLIEKLKGFCQEWWPSAPGNSVEVLLTRYAKCLDGRQDVANRRIEDLLREYE
jgi:hypothetical protein